MKRNRKALTILLSGIVFLSLSCYLVIGNPIVFINNHRLKQAICAIDTQKVQFNEVVPFQWDTLYTFDPYQSKEEIEEIIGFESLDVKENFINEGMVHLLFVKDDRIVASVLGYQENLGYAIDFSSKGGEVISYREDAVFQIRKTESTVILEWIEKENSTD